MKQKFKYFITGGAGSLGQTLTRKLIDNGHTVIIYSRDEGKHAEVFNDERNVFKVIGDVRDFDKLKMTMEMYTPHFVIHAGALKRLDDMEYYPDECVNTNVQGSENVARAALETQVWRAILVSTDKACKPVNVYGASKFIAERLFTNYDHRSHYMGTGQTSFASIRYGNVIASRGSFIPMFMQWIKDGQEVRITSEEMTRFLFTLDDAAESVLDALHSMEGGEVFVPKLSSYTLPDCVKALENIAGRKADVEIIGVRPGEKLHEDMLAETELDNTYEIPDTNLLQIRPQYGNRIYNKRNPKYEGPPFNSALWVSDDIEQLTKLIERGLKDK